MTCSFWRVRWLILIGLGLAACTPVGGQSTDTARYLVYFDEFSANLSPEATAIIADAAKRVRESGARAIVVEARASATGTAQTNRKLAETRSSIVADQLQADGIARAMIRQVPIGQTGSNDPTVTERRVDIIIEP
jgi:outer membrane protein OmpA-like peptidoglycan-associated protein